MTTNEEVEKLKVGIYKVYFKTDFNQNDSDYINLNLKISRDLKDLVKNIVTPEQVDASYNTGNSNEVFPRFKVKTWVYSSLGGEFGMKDVLFSKKILEDSEFDLKVVSIEYLEMFISELRNLFKKLIEVCLQAQNYEINVSYNLKKNE